jgi:phosphotriesterase-related protein
MATAQTVPGPAEAGQLGRVLMHEHLLCLLPGPWPYGGPSGPEALGEEQAGLRPE